jgi:hypothetical protein
MIITNFYNLPAPIVEACRKKFAPRNYNDTTFSITELMQPPPLTKIINLKDLPRNATNYIDFIGNQLATPIDVISVGPGREQTLWVKPLFS